MRIYSRSFSKISCTNLVDVCELIREISLEKVAGSWMRSSA